MEEQVIFAFEAIKLFGIGFITGLSGAIIPGPLFAFVISDALKKGFMSGPLAACGHIIVELPVFIAFILGIGALLMRFHQFIYAAGAIVLILMALLIIREVIHNSSNSFFTHNHANSTKNSISINELTKNSASHRTQSQTSSASPIAPPDSRNHISHIQHNTQQNAQNSQHNTQISERMNKRGSVIGGVMLTAFNPSFIPWWMAIGFPILLVGLSSPLAHIGAIIVFIGHISSDISWYSLVSFFIAIGRRRISGVWYKMLMLAVASFLAFLGVFFIIKALV